MYINASEPEITVKHMTTSDYFCQLSNQKSICLDKVFRYPISEKFCTCFDTFVLTIQRFNFK